MTETLSPALPDPLEEKVHAVLAAACRADLTIATAESCTGGLLASLLTDVEGAGHAFERGFVVYSEQSKCELLAVDRGQLDDCGAVSRQVAIAMARGALANSTADIALSITGYAGSKGAQGEPGLVHFACARRDGPIDAREEHYGDVGRGPVRLGAIGTALDMIGAAIAAGG